MPEPLQSIGKGNCDECTRKKELFAFGGIKSLCTVCMDVMSIQTRNRALAAKSNRDFLTARRMMGGEDE